MILSYQTIKLYEPISPIHEKTNVRGLSYGLSACGYDIRIAEDLILWPHRFVLASSIEEFIMPTNISAVVHDKSTWIRKGIAVHNTFIEPGWYGYLTLELKNLTWKFIKIQKGDPIAQIVFHSLDHPTEKPYQGKYQNQEAGPQQPRVDYKPRSRAARFNVGGIAGDDTTKGF